MGFCAILQAVGCLRYQHYLSKAVWREVMNLTFREMEGVGMVEVRRLLPQTRREAGNLSQGHGLWEHRGAVTERGIDNAEPTGQ